MRHATQKRTIHKVSRSRYSIEEADQADYGARHGSGVSVQVSVWCI